MSITVLNTTLSQKVIAAGVKGRTIRKNQRVTTVNGYESINALWNASLREYDVGIGPLRREQWQEIETLFEITSGGAYGFLMLDPKDQNCDYTEGRAAAVDGFPGYYWLYKRYSYGTTGVFYKDRRITRPILTGFTAYVSGSPVDALLEVTTGLLSFATHTNYDAATVSWSGKFNVPVHFLNDQIDWEMVVSGQDVDGRFYTGPTVTLQEIREDPSPTVFV